MVTRLSREFNEQPQYYIGLFNDTKPTEDVTEGSYFEVLDNGGMFRFTEGRWIFHESTKSYDHDGQMLALGLTYKACLYEPALGANENLVLRFFPQPGKAHHAERRILNVFGSRVEFGVYEGRTNALPPLANSLPKINQKGMHQNGSTLIFDNHGKITDAELTTLLTGTTRVDIDVLFATASQGNNPGGGAGSSLVQGRHYDPQEYIVVYKNIGTAAASIFYAYIWHEFQV